jgi:hypothetical protein
MSLEKSPPVVIEDKYRYILEFSAADPVLFYLLNPVSGSGMISSFFSGSRILDLALF